MTASIAETHAKPAPDAILAELLAEFGPKTVLSDPADMQRYCREPGSGHSRAGLDAGVLGPDGVTLKAQAGNVQHDGSNA